VVMVQLCDGCGIIYVVGVSCVCVECYSYEISLLLFLDWHEYGRSSERVRLHLILPAVSLL